MRPAQLTSIVLALVVLAFAAAGFLESDHLVWGTLDDQIVWGN